MSFDLYKDIAERTNGDIYIGVIGPVRTGKSTFIKGFMKHLVIPYIEDVHKKERAIDEMPQSGSGRQIMTTEPKFIPNNGVEITMEDSVNFNVRLIDCVGYMVEGANGAYDGENPRMISTPWFEHKIPFEEAGEIGTRKVIQEHSTIGIVVVTDGSVTDLPRENYIEAENKVINELKELDKPFVIVLNTANPFSDETIELAENLQLQHGVTVIPLNCDTMRKDDIHKVLQGALYEFPLRNIAFKYPRWIETLENDHWLKVAILNSIKNLAGFVYKINDITNNINKFDENEYIKKAYVDLLELGKGQATVDININDDLFFTVLSEFSELDIPSEYELINQIKSLAKIKKEYDKVKDAFDEVAVKGYGIVTPQLNEMTLSEPEIVKHGNKYGVKVKAKAPSIHLVRADIETEVNPIVGSEQQSNDLVRFIMEEMEKEDGQIWEFNMFGKSMQDLVHEGIQNKLYRMPDEARAKLQDSLQKMINENVKIGVMILV